jgi:hypothetical protein
MHWQFRSASFTRRYRWGAERFTAQFGESLDLSNVTHFSVYAQGTFNGGDSHHAVLNFMDRLCNKAITLMNARLYVLRLSHLVRLRVQRVEQKLAGDGRNRGYAVVRPGCEGLPVQDWGDGDTGVDCGWRQGVLFLPGDDADGGQGFLTSRYTIWTPMPKGVQWPLIT